MKEPRISVLTATYNQERFIARCVESVLAQSRPDWEMILFDDGSGDGTREVVRRYADRRIVLIEHEHTGIGKLGERYNQALARARGGLLAILDGDDWWPPEKLRLQAAAFDDPDTVFSHGSCELYDEDGRRLTARPLIPSFRGRRPGRRFLEALLARRHIPWSPTVMIRAGAIRAIGGFVQPSYAPLVDYPTWLRLVSRGSVYGMGAVVGCYRIRASSVARRMAEQIAEGHWKYVQEYLDAEGENLGLAPRERATLLRWSRAAYEQDLARIRMKEGRAAVARAHFRRAFQDGPAWLKLRAAIRLLQTALL